MEDLNLIRERTESNNILNELSIYKIRMLVWVILVYSATIILQFLEEIIYVKVGIFTILMMLHLILNRFSDRFKNNYAWYYFFLQCSIIFISAFILPHGSPIILIGLLPILIAQSIHIFNHTLKVIFCIVLLYLPYSYAIIVNYGIQELPFFIPILFFIMAIAVFYSILYVREANAWKRMKYYLQELQMANKKIEELTIVNERKRIARDLHDTLAQGLAGLIMKLEAIDVHLHKDNVERAREIVQQSMYQARTALKDAREAIDDLRSESLSEINFVKEVNREVSRFTDATSIEVICSWGFIPKLTNHIKQHGLHIIIECLINIAKHAKADQVKIAMKHEKDELIIRISDNGVGFNTKTIGKQIGQHYGLIGLYERVRILDGEIKIQSELGKGTNIVVSFPVQNPLKY